MKLAYATFGWRRKIDETLAAIADLGFEGVELYDLLDRVENDEDVGALLARYGLALSSAYFAGSFVQRERVAQELRDFETVVEAIASFDGNVVVVGGGRRRRLTEEKDWIELTKTAARMCCIAERYGVTLAWHPHYGTLVQNTEEAGRLLREVAHPGLSLAIDIAHVAFTGADPISTLSHYGKAVKHIHLKDFAKGAFVELGQGTLDIPGVMTALAQGGYDGWVTVELDSAEDAKTSALANARYLEQIGVKKEVKKTPLRDS
jgi:inosose dehydratase